MAITESFLNEDLKTITIKTNNNTITYSKSYLMDSFLNKWDRHIILIKRPVVLGSGSYDEARIKGLIVKTIDSDIYTLKENKNAKNKLLNYDASANTEYTLDLILKKDDILIGTINIKGIASGSNEYIYYHSLNKKLQNSNNDIIDYLLYFGVTDVNSSTIIKENHIIGNLTAYKEFLLTKTLNFNGKNLEDNTGTVLVFLEQLEKVLLEKDSSNKYLYYDEIMQIETALKELIKDCSNCTNYKGGLTYYNQVYYDNDSRNIKYTSVSS